MTKKLNPARKPGGTERDIWRRCSKARGRSRPAAESAPPSNPALPSSASALKSGLTQEQFAALLGVSKRTLEQWEQGRRNPSGAAKTLLRVAELHPELLREIAA